ncbi:LPXTG-motif cell wall-anchored protein [Paenibacillus harenae]|uniref:LPXTG-motif cell wall-anchored protein n=1 Tax=Paenibacillus harenae TaxID=306543 RepID=A0ABT9UA87_PAEHA|nr:LPXTG-motif cell wall-anchored protein [Paenibacillus harenae]
MTEEPTTTPTPTNEPTATPETEVVVDEDETPQGSADGDEEEVVVEDNNEIPQGAVGADIDAVGGKEASVTDTVVPLATLPKTGDTSSLPTYMVGLGLLLIGLLLIGLLSFRKKKITKV